MQMKKKILFVAQNFEVGGVQTALISLLNNLQKNHLAEYDIKLFSFGRGSLVGQIPEGISENFGNFFLSVAVTPFGKVLKTKNPVKIIIRLMLMIYVRIAGTEKFYRNQLKKHIYSEDFDVAISYFNDVPDSCFNRGTELYVKEFVSADKKIAWIHTDPVKSGFDKEYCKNMYREYDKIMCVSKAVKQSFETLLPEYSGKTDVFYNILNEDRVTEKVKEYIPFEKNGRFNIVTICRIDDATKRVKGIVSLCNMLKSEGVTNFRWRIVGDGPDLKKNKKFARKLGICDVLEFVGEHENPYPYMYSSDLFALYSAYEGYPMVIEEAKFLKTPVLTINYAAASEQVNAEDGQIAFSDEDFYERLKMIIINSKEYEA